MNEKEKIKEEEYKRQIYLLQLYREQIEEIYAQMELIERFIGEYSRAIETLQELAGIEEKDALMPLGGNSFAHVEIKDLKKVLVNVGRGIFIEKTLNGAIDFMNKKIEDLKKSEQNLAKTAEEIRLKMEELSIKLENVQVS